MQVKKVRNKKDLLSISSLLVIFFIHNFWVVVFTIVLAFAYYLYLKGKKWSVLGLISIVIVFVVLNKVDFYFPNLEFILFNGQTFYSPLNIGVVSLLLLRSLFLINKEGVLLKRYRDGVSGIDGMIEDYAFFIWGLLELYQITFKDEYINLAVDLSDYQFKNFWDSQNHGFYFTSNLSESLIVRSKEIYDGAIPSGNSVSACNYIRLSKILSRPDYEEVAIKTIDAFAYTLNRYGYGSSMMMQAINMIQNPFYEIIIVGNKDKSKDFINYLHNVAQPNKVLIYYDGKNKNKNFNFLDYYKSNINGEPLVYVCQNFSCKLPTSDFKIIDELLE